MNPRMVNVDRRTPMLLPPDLREWVAADDLVHFVVECVEAMTLTKLVSNRRGTGSEQYPPKMMLALLIYCYANGVFSSRRIERATHRDVAVRYLTGNTHPDHDTICKFRRENFEAVAEAFLHVLHLARQMGLLKVGTVSVDGTHIKANAAKDRTVRYDRAVELEKQLEGEIRTLMTKAEQADQNDSDDGQQLPKQIATREALRAKLQEAKAALEFKAQARAQAARAGYEAKIAQRQRIIDEGGKPKGRTPKPPALDDTPRPEDKINLTDPESVTMRKSQGTGYQQSYNAQAVVDADGSMLVLASHVIQTPADFGQLEVGVDKVDASVGTVSAALADAGYVKRESIEHLQSRNVDVYVAVRRQVLEDHPHDLQSPAHGRPRKAPRKLSDPIILAMEQKLKTEEGKTQYRKRHQSAEPVFGIVKHVLGFTQFLLRGLQNVTGEWSLVSLAYNVKRVWRLRQQHAVA